MFNFLKNKIKSWASKLKPEEEKQKKPVKKEKEAKKRKKQKIKFVEPISDFNAGQNVEPNIEKTKEEIKQKKSFFSFLKKDKGQQKVGESLDKETDKELAKQLYEGKKTEQEPAQEEKPEINEKKGFFDRFRTKLDEEKFEELFQELEMILLQNNVAYEVVEKIKKSLAEQLIGKNLKDVKIEDALKNAIENILLPSPDFLKEIKTSLTQKQPFVIAFVGINGSGKTTTIAKVANMIKKNKLSVCLAAADTFRAAAIQQLEEHASRLGVPIIKKDYGADPASVGFDAIAYAKKHHIDVVLIDTAGRMNTKDSLMKEMEKIIRVNKPDMKIFIGESITGNDATQQAKDFNEAIDLTGIILSKADVDEKSGAVLSVSYVTKKPILFLGVGQTYNDLEVFDKKKIIERLGL
jgi:fused signal recognition particle receptor